MELLVFFILSTACDLLDKGPLDMISDAVVWDDPVLAEAYIANFDYTKAGAYGSESWKEKAKIEVGLEKAFDEAIKR